MTVTERFEIPPEMRAFAEKSVEQARQAFDGFISAAHRAVSAFEGQAESARKGAKDVSEKAIVFAQSNIATPFDFAQKLVQARNVEEVLKLQADYIKTQMQVLTEQAWSLAKAPARWPGTPPSPNTDGRLPICCPACRRCPSAEGQIMVIVQCNIFYCVAPQPMLYCGY